MTGVVIMAREDDEIEDEEDPEHDTADSGLSAAGEEDEREVNVVIDRGGGDE
jgi:hypothetical protein